MSVQRWGKVIYRRLTEAPPSTLAIIIFAIALLKALILLLASGVAYGADGRFYLRYMDSFIAADPNPETIFGATPIYPLFAYITYNIGFTNGQTIAVFQNLLGAIAAASLYLALRPIHIIGATLVGLLVAIDPQSGHLINLVSTEGLYIPLLILGLAAFIYETQRDKLSWVTIGTGLLLGLGMVTRPVGMLLWVVYLFFYAILTRSIRRSAWVAAAIAVVFLSVALLNLWRFDFFGLTNTNGLYLGARLFSQPGLFQPENGEASEAIQVYIDTCNVPIEDGFSGYADLRVCMEERLDLLAIGDLYRDAYFEALARSPQTYVSDSITAGLRYLWLESSAVLPDSVPVVSDALCAGENGEWYDTGPFFCTLWPRPLEGIHVMIFWGVLGFSVFTRAFINFPLAAWSAQWTTVRIRWLLLLCLAVYLYHLATTIAANDVLSRYITVTNPFTLTTLGLALGILWEHFGGTETDE